MSDRLIELGVALETMSIIDSKELQGLKYESDFLKFIFTQFDTEFMNDLERKFLDSKDL